MPRFLAGLEKQSSESGHFVGDQVQASFPTEDHAKCVQTFELRMHCPGPFSFQLSYADIAFYYNSTLVEYIKVREIRCIRVHPHGARRGTSRKFLVPRSFLLFRLIQRMEKRACSRKKNTPRTDICACR